MLSGMPAGVSIQDALLVLENCLSTDTNTRIKAEIHLKELFRNESTIPVLLELSLSVQDIAKRQIAVFALKNYVESHWSNKNEKFIGPEPSEETKAFVRASLLQQLGDPCSKIRIQLALVIAKIAHSDWPEQWPDLLDILLGFLKSTNQQQVDGAVKVLKEFVSYDICQKQFSFIAQTIAAELFRITSSSHSADTRADCVVIFKDLIEMMDTLKLEFPNEINECLGQWLTNWIPLFEKLLLADDFSVRKAIIDTFIVLINDFAKETVGFSGRLIEHTWSSLVATSQMWTGHDDLMTEFIEQALEFFKILLQNDLFNEFFEAQTPFLGQLVHSSIKLMQIPMDSFSEDLSDFCQDELAGFPMRSSAVELVIDLLEGYPVATTNAIQLFTSEFSNGSIELKEAFLFCLSQLKAGSLQGFDSVFLESFRSESLLQGRALVAASTNSQINPVELAQFSIQLLSNPNKIMWYFSLVSLNSLVKSINDSFIISKVIQQIGGLIGGFDGILLEIALQVFTCIGKSHPMVTLEYFESILQVILDLWSKNLINTCVTVKLEELVSELCVIDLKRAEQGLLSTVNELISSNQDESVISFALDLLATLASKNQHQLDPFYSNTVLPCVIQRLLVYSQPCLILKGQEALKQILLKTLISNECQSGLAALLIKCLDPHLDGCAVKVGELFGLAKFTINIDHILTATVSRLERATDASLIQSLVMVFCHLIKTNAAFTIEFLANIDALSLFMKTWTENFGSFNGFYDLKLSCFCLGKVFELNDARLLSLSVKGDLILSNKIMTRSRARNQPQQFTIVPFPVKVVKLFIQEYLQQLESQVANSTASEQGSDDDEPQEEQEALVESNLSDPIAALDIQKFIVEFFTTHAQHPLFQVLLNEHLTATEKEQVGFLLK